MNIHFHPVSVQSLFVLIILFTTRVSGFSQQVSQGQLGNLIKVSFEYPADILTSQSFYFTVKLQKVSGYRPAGQIVITWPQGFLPEFRSNGWIQFTADGQRMSAHWMQMPDERELRVMFRVVVQNNPPGIYPVIFEYQDALGVKMHRVLSLAVAKDEKSTTTIEPSSTSSQISISIQSPDEIPTSGVFTATISISNVTSTLPAYFKMTLPPGFSLATEPSVKHHFSANNGMLELWWDPFPAAKQVNIPLQFMTRDVIPAIYPIYASFYLSGSLISEVTSYLKVKGEGSQQKAKTLPEPAQVDTAKLFEEFDRVLQQWISASKGETSTSSGNNQSTETSPTRPPVPAEKEEVSYRIQIFASPTKPNHLQNLVRKKGITEPIREEYDGQIFRYTLGNFSTEEEAREYLNSVRTRGFPDAFIVKYINGIRQK